MACWAYYPGPGEEGRRPEPLGKHLIDVAMRVRAHRDFNRLVRKIARDYNLDAGLVSDFITLAGGLHDIGKAIAKYQEDPARGFSGHEVYSTLIIAHALYTSGISYNTPIGRLLVYPVLLHHYAQRDDLEVAYKKVLREVGSRVEVWRGCVDDLGWALGNIRGLLTTCVGRRVIDALASSVASGWLPVYVDGSLMEGLKTIVDVGDWFGVMAVTGLLNEVDGEVAGSARGW